MEIKVGILHVNREIVMESAESSAELEEELREALKSGGLLTLTDDRGRKVLIPAQTVGYIDIGEENARHVGFSSL